MQKFHQLWKAGLNAHLDLDTHAGIAWVGLRVQLGHVPGPLHHQAHHTPFKINQDSPSRQRRRDRRAAARNAIAEEVQETETEKVSSPSDKVDKEVLDEQSSDTDDAIVKIVNVEHTAAANAVNEETDSICDLCDAKFNNLRGLRAHKGRIHKGAPITQLDGVDDTDCNMSEKCITYTFVSDFHQEDVEYTIKEIFPENIGTRILSNEKVGDRLSADHLFSVLIELPDDRRFSWPQMSADQAVVFKDVLPA